MLGQSVAEDDASRGGRFQPQQPPDQGAFAGAVFAHDAEIIPGVYGEIDVIRHDGAVVGERYVGTGNLRHYCKAFRRFSKF